VFISSTTTRTITKEIQNYTPMDFTSHTLFDDAIHSISLDINLDQEDLAWEDLCAYDNQLSHDRYDGVIAPSDLFSLNSLDLIAAHSAFVPSKSQSLLQVPALDLSASPPLKQTQIVPSKTLQRSDSDVSYRSSSAGGDNDTIGWAESISTGTCEAEFTSEDSVTTPPKNSRQRKRKRKRQLTPAEEQAKRTKFLERNRLAANKCRRKKKRQADHLKEKKTTLEAENKLLKLQLGETRDEVNTLQNIIMMHALCDHLPLSSKFQVEKEPIATAVYPTPARSLSNPVSPAAELHTESDRTGVPSKQESVASLRPGIELIE